MARGGRDAGWQPPNVVQRPNRLFKSSVFFQFRVSPGAGRLRSASRHALLRVPGLGPVTAKRILQARKQGGLRSLEPLGLRGKRLETVSRYVLFE